MKPIIAVDLFAGAGGTTAKVAKDLGRSSISIELNPRYCQLVKQRIGFGQEAIDGSIKYIYTKVK